MAARLPGATADAKHRIQSESRGAAHARLPQVAAQDVCKRRDEGCAVAAVYIDAVAEPACEPVNESCAVEPAPTVMRAASAWAIVRDYRRSKVVNALRHATRGSDWGRGPQRPSTGVLHGVGPWQLSIGLQIRSLLPRRCRQIQEHEDAVLRALEIDPRAVFLEPVLPPPFRRMGADAGVAKLHRLQLKRNRSTLTRCEAHRSSLDFPEHVAEECTKDPTYQAEEPTQATGWRRRVDDCVDRPHPSRVNGRIAA